jgi:thioredoxin 1
MKFLLRLNIRAASATTLAFLLIAATFQISVAQTRPGAVKVTFVEIGAAKCIPCKAMQPIMKEVGEEYKGQVKVLFHDVWTQQGKMDAEKYNIRMIPTQVFLDKDGKEYFRHEGYFPKEDLIKVLKIKGIK